MPNNPNKRVLGSHYEDIACSYLRSKDIVILDKNFRTRFGEIDIIAHDGKSYIFIEVKYRSGNSKGDPSEAVGPRKQETIRKQALIWLAKKGLGDLTPCRFDVISILGNNIRWTRNAF